MQAIKIAHSSYRVRVYLHFFYLLSCGLLSYSLGSIGHAAVPASDVSSDPAELVRIIISDVTQDMRDNEDLYAEEPQMLREMVEQRAMANFNFPRMTQLAMARNWKLADTEQKTALIREFQATLIRSYTNTLFNYRYAQPRIQSQNRISEKKTLIKLRMTDKSSDSVTLFLKMEKTDDGWKIVDINVEGVSLVITARGQFTEKISEVGINGLIQSLADENNGLSE